MSPEYLAGFFDGEGCIDTQRNYPKANSRFYCRPRVRVAQAASGAYLVERLSELYGGHCTRREPKNGNQQASVSWELLGKDSILVMLRQIEPFLILKREQAKLVIWWLENMSGRQTKSGYPKMESARLLLAEELKLMKLDPQRLSEGAVARIELLMR